MSESRSSSGLGHIRGIAWVCGAAGLGLDGAEGVDGSADCDLPLEPVERVTPIEAERAGAPDLPRDCCLPASGEKEGIESAADNVDVWEMPLRQVCVASCENEHLSPALQVPEFTKLLHTCTCSSPVEACSESTTTPVFDDVDDASSWSVPVSIDSPWHNWL